MTDDLAREQAEHDWVSDWINGALHDDGETYTAPVEALAADDVLADLLTARTDEELAAAARRCARQLRQHILERMV